MGNPFDQGFRAFNEGKSLSDCPYLNGTSAKDRWQSGWYAAKSEKAERELAVARARIAAVKKAVKALDTPLSREEAADATGKKNAHDRALTALDAALSGADALAVVEVSIPRYMLADGVDLRELIVGHVEQSGVVHGVVVVLSNRGESAEAASGAWRTGQATPGAWCWVTDGEDVWPAVADPVAAGGWTNNDTWEDFGGAVVAWMILNAPRPPARTGTGRGESAEVDDER